MWHQYNPADKENGLECACVNNDEFTLLVSEGGRCCLVRVWTVWPVHSKWLSKYSNKFISSFVLSFSTPTWKQFWWFRRPQLWATGDEQLHHHNVPAHASHLTQGFLFKHQITQVTQPPYSTDLAPCNFWLFPKLK